MFLILADVAFLILLTAGSMIHAKRRKEIEYRQLGEIDDLVNHDTHSSGLFAAAAGGVSLGLEKFIFMSGTHLNSLSHCLGRATQIFSVGLALITFLREGLEIWQSHASSFRKVLVGIWAYSMNGMAAVCGGLLVAAIADTGLGLVVALIGTAAFGVMAEKIKAFYHNTLYKFMDARQR